MYKKQILFIMCILLCCSGLAVAQPVPTLIAEGQVTLAWDANSETDLGGYKAHYGTVSGVYDIVIDVKNETSYTVKGLEVGKLYYFVVTAYNTSNAESGYSEEVSGNGKNITPPGIPSGLREVIAEIVIRAKSVTVIQD